ncbi:MAG: DNA methyltransferase, partial [Dolichospermum sp.]
YTPDYIVKYIVSHTLKPILEERKQKFADLMTQINQLHEKITDGRLGVQSRNGLQKDLQRLERQAQNTLLDIKICDPAMGSGHFLVEAVDYLTDELINILNEYSEHNPILEMLGKTRNSILENLQQQGINIDINLDDNQLLQRVVMKRCIYGVDLNPMAVELAKVSLWLHFFTIGAPLSFLDHHLRCGNSLIGTTAREAEANMIKEESGQLSLLT